MIIGGALGNLLDRMLYKRVVDFMDVDIPDIGIPAFEILSLQFPGFELHRWPVFNVADVFITAGMILLIIVSFYDKEFMQI